MCRERRVSSPRVDVSLARTKDMTYRSEIGGCELSGDAWICFHGSMPWIMKLGERVQGQQTLKSTPMVADDDSESKRSSQYRISTGDELSLVPSVASKREDELTGTFASA